MKKVLVLSCLVFMHQVLIAQSGQLQEIISQIEFQSDSIKSVFDWIADNVEYDIGKMNDIEEGDISPPKKNIGSQEELREVQLDRVISRKKGVCEDYSLLFDAIVRELGYTSYIIVGYVKNAQGKVERRVGHSWNTVKVNGIWSLYDPTWGAGYLGENGKYTKRYNKEWFDISPSEMVKTHMPYDPLWQLSEHPLTYNFFEGGVAESSFDSPFNYEEEISLYFQKDPKEQMKDQLLRSERLGNGIWLIERWRNNMRSRIDHYDLTHQALSIDEVNIILTESTDTFNEYIKARNKQFRSKKWTGAYSKQAMLKIQEDLSSVLASLQNVEVADSQIDRSVEKVILQTERFLQRINEEIIYLDKHF